MKTEANLDEYRVPDHTFRLLCTWGRCYMVGAPRLWYDATSPSCREYIAPSYREEGHRFDMDDFDRITAIIDNALRLPHQEALKCRFRYTTPDGKQFNKRDSSSFLNIKPDEYLTLLRSAMRQVDILLNGERDDD